MQVIKFKFLIIQIKKIIESKVESKVGKIDNFHKFYNKINILNFNKH
jgi:hypothetical protein